MNYRPKITSKISNKKKQKHKKKALIRHDPAPPSSYPLLLDNIKKRIQTSRIKAGLAVNRELIQLYWEIGKEIILQQNRKGWGKSVVKRLGEDLRSEFSDLRGFSGSNLWRMRAFFLAYVLEGKNLAQAARDLNTKALAQLARQLDGSIIPPEITEIPWFHNVVLVEKLKSSIKRLWYARQTIEHGWSRAVLVHQIETGLYERQGKALTNFSATLPTPQSDLARQLIKDPYNFGFIGLGTDISERQLEDSLVNRIKDFLMELGKGFSFIGQQYHLEVGGKDYFMDLLFYHHHLRCFIIIDLKVVPFEPEFAGKMNFYLSAVDDKLRHTEDHPTIGIILCKKRNKIVVEYALRDTNKPMGVATYRMLPAKLKAELPSAQQIEAGIKNNGPVGKGGPH